MNLSMFPWLIAGMAMGLLCMGRVVIPAAAWIGPILLLHFVREAPVAPGMLLLWLGLFLAFVTSNRKVLPVPGAGYFVVALPLSLTMALPYLADRLLESTFPGLLSTLAFPLAWVAMEYLGSLGSNGSWGALAYTQHGNLPLAQLASVTGIPGISFLITWTAAVANWAWDSGFAWTAIGGGVCIWAGVMGLVVIAGAVRLEAARSDGNAVRAATLSYPKNVFVPGEITRIIEGRVAPEEHGEISGKLRRMQDWFLENALREARAGAKIIAWPETNMLVLRDEEAGFMERARRVAREEHIHLLMGIASVQVGARRPTENKAVLLTPDGAVAYSYLKSRLVPGWESRTCVRGDGRLPTAQTELGRVASPICYEMDLPGFVRQTGRRGTDLVIVPANDWKEIKHIHHRMAVYRAIENGFPMLRASSAFSGAVDAFGRVLATADHFGSDVRNMVAQIPVGRVPTVYARIGNLFSWISIAGLVAMIAWAAFALGG
jgi:apolipoprotein N-acyltransferase